MFWIDFKQVTNRRFRRFVHRSKRSYWEQNKKARQKPGFLPRM
ncbi:hypothetical protein ARMA_1776 [Ardenticatena maritima]|uniref:Uncharacterized protein n=1 Tax=Ardenticatena maritima TaxID=872965 RepID=A0A0M8K7F7_9CHLR|nr:hypothetical protein ARMA_1776 [Ardenticatena maritima]